MQTPVSKAVVTVLGFDSKGIIAQVSQELDELAARIGLEIRIQKSEIFEAMHQI